MLLTNQSILDALSVGLPILIESVRQPQKQRPQRFYSLAAIANASSNPRLAGTLNQNGGLPLCRELERQSLTNLHIFGSRMGDCAKTALYHLSERKEGDVNYAATKYRFKYGTKPSMELSLANYSKYGGTLWFCFIVWLLIMFFMFSPLIRV